MESEELNIDFNEVADQFEEDLGLEFGKDVSVGLPMMFINVIYWIITAIAWLIMAFLCGTVGITYWK